MTTSTINLTPAQIRVLKLACEYQPVNEEEEWAGRVDTFGKPSTLINALVQAGCIERRPRYTAARLAMKKRERDAAIAAARSCIEADWQAAHADLNEASYAQRDIDEKRWFITDTGRTAAGA